MHTAINPKTDPMIKARAQRQYLLIFGGLALYIGYRIAQGSGIAGAVVVLVLLAALTYRVSFQKPRFVVSDTGVSFPWINGEVRWEEVESMRFVLDGTSVAYPWSQIQLEVRDPAALANRITLLYQPLVSLYRPFGQMRWFTGLNASHSPIPLPELADEIERRAGRSLRTS